MTAVDSSDGPAERSAVINGARRVVTAVPGVAREAVAIVNGLFGDTLEHRDSRMATSMTIRAGDTLVPLDSGTPHEAVAAAVPNASSRITLLVHGLMSTESIWQFPDGESTTYGTLLAEDRDMTVLSLRYNTGRHISTNGRELAQLLNLLQLTWPVRVREINLIGHSMGGLVVRSACHYGRVFLPRGRHLQIARRWTSKVRRVVLIGVPNDGAGLEAFVNSTSAVLRALPLRPTQLVGLGLDQRSSGIKDLRFGAIHDEDWAEQEPGIRHRPNPHRPHRLRRAAFLVVAGSITEDPAHPVARVMGDALVTGSSAAGLVGEGQLFPGADIRMFPKLKHNMLAHHEDVFDAIDEWW